MNATEAKALVFDILGGIAPESEPTTLSGGANMREALDLDSMDFLNFVIALHERTGLPIPEPDYPRLLTLNGAVDYLVKASRG